MNLLRSLARLALIAAAGCSALDDVFGKECTAIGCLTFLRIELSVASGASGDALQVIIEHDGKSAICDFGATDDPCHRGFQPDFDPGAAPGSSDGEGPLVVLINEAPKQLRITVTTAKGSESRVVEPDYAHNRPNGPDCGPGCLSASTTLHFDL